MKLNRRFVLFMLTSILLMGGVDARAGVYEWTYDMNKATLSPTFKYKKGSSYETKLTYNIKHNNVTYTNALKIEGDTRIYFTTSASQSNITIAYVLKQEGISEEGTNFKVPAICLCQNTETNIITSNINSRYTYKDGSITRVYYFCTYKDVSAGDWIIKKDEGEQIGVFYIKVEDDSESTNLAAKGHVKNKTQPKIWESFETDNVTVYLGGWKYQSSKESNRQNALSGLYRKTTDKFITKGDGKPTSADYWKTPEGKYKMGNEDPCKRGDLISDASSSNYEAYSYANENGRNEFTEGKYWGRYEFHDEIVERDKKDDDGNTYSLYSGERLGGNPFTMPCIGSFARIEPKKNGKITFHVIQNATIDFDTSNTRETNGDEDKTGTLLSGASWRPVFIVDERGMRLGETDVTATTRTEHTIGRGEKNALVYNFDKNMYVYCVELLNKHTKKPIEGSENEEDVILGEALKEFDYTGSTSRGGYYTSSESDANTYGLQYDKSTKYDYVIVNNKKVYVSRITYKETVEERDGFPQVLTNKLGENKFDSFFSKKFPVYYEDDTYTKEVPFGTSNFRKFVEVWPEEVRTTAAKSDADRKWSRVWGPKYTGEGWLVIAKGYVDYEFEVKAGKSYYIFSNDTKFGFCGFDFQAVKEDLPTLTLTDDGKYRINDSAEKDITRNFLNEIVDGGKPKTFASVTLERSFHPGWNAICLPFSVTESKMREWFGKPDGGLYKEFYELVTYNGAKLLKDEKDGDKYKGEEYEGKLRAHFFRHIYQDIVAGIPYMLYIPETAKAVNLAEGEYVTFDNITIENDKFTMMRSFTTSANNLPVKDYTKIDYHNTIDGSDYIQGYGYEDIGYLYEKGPEKDYTSYGNYAPVQPEKGSYLVLKAGIQLYEGDNVTLPSFRSYLHPGYDAGSFSSLARIAATNFTVILDEQEEDWNATVINDLLAEELGFFNRPANVYSVSGQLVRANSTSLVGLPKGVYIVNGKKYLVK